jgi:DNA-binding beta-propeller fold protein YncE
MNARHVLLAASLALIAACANTDSGRPATRDSSTPPAANYRVDPFWPKPLRGNWMLGQVAWVAVDSRDHVWILHRPGSILDDEKGALAKPPTSKCCTPAPAVIEFDPQGNFVRGWGGPGEGYDWPKNEHGIYVDPQGNVWIAGNDNADHQVLKFTREGKFLMQIGKPGKSEGSGSRTQLGRPAHMEVDPSANELFIADGYGNRRVIVFDASKGTYKRHWGAYGTPPSDEKMPPYSPGARPSQFGNVHCVHQSRDNYLYICDRTNDRIQVFSKQGTFLKEFFIEPQTLQSGSAFDIAFSPDPGQLYLYVADGTNAEVHVISRDDGKRIGSFGRPGRMAGEFRSVHGMASDSKGNLYTAEVGNGRRVQKFVMGR